MGAYINPIDHLIQKYLPILKRDIYSSAMEDLAAMRVGSVDRIKKATHEGADDMVIRAAEEIVEIQRAEKALTRRLAEIEKKI